MRKFLKTTVLTATAAGLVVGLTACSSGGSSDAASADPNKPLVIAATSTPHAQILKFVQDNLASQAGLKLDIKEVSDYVTPNTSVQDGSADANFFQHQPYLDDFNKKNGTDLVTVETVHLEPLGAYSHKVKNLADLKDGAVVSVPSDATNEGRALKLLADNNLITLKDGAGTTATADDIASNPKHLKIKELEAAQLPRSLDDVDASVINSNFAIGAGLKPTSDALVVEKAQDNPYANILVVKKGHQEDPRVKKLAELLHSDAVKKYIEDNFQGAVIPAF